MCGCTEELCMKWSLIVPVYFPLLCSVDWKCMVVRLYIQCDNTNAHFMCPVTCKCLREIYALLWTGSIWTLLSNTVSLWHVFRPYKCIFSKALTLIFLFSSPVLLYATNVLYGVWKMCNHKLQSSSCHGIVIDTLHTQYCFIVEWVDVIVNTFIFMMSGFILHQVISYHSWRFLWFSSVLPGKC
jgi:hypothetical protein